jgi:hypothetical protein
MGIFFAPQYWDRVLFFSLLEQDWPVEALDFEVRRAAV